MMNQAKPPPAKRTSYVRAARVGEKLERRSHIIKGALNVLRGHGVEKFTLESVAREIGLSRGGMYGYFRTREELLLAIHVEVNVQFFDRISARLRPNLKDEEFVSIYLDEVHADEYLVVMIRLFERMANNAATAGGKKQCVPQYDPVYDASGRKLTDAVAACLQLERRQVDILLWAMSALIVGSPILQRTRALAQTGERSDVSALRLDERISQFVFDSCLATLRGVRGSI